MSLRQNRASEDVYVFEFSYQSECHCAKTIVPDIASFDSLVTSQNVTAPKQLGKSDKTSSCLVTSQNVTAPKHIYTDL